MKRRKIRAGEEYTDDDDIELEQIPAKPEPPDIDRFSREHDQKWAEHFRGSQ